MASNGITTWLGEHRVDGKLVARIGRKGEELVAEFPNLGVFTVSARGTRSHFELSTGAAPSSVDKLRDSLLDALTRHAQGKVTLHGGAACLEGRVVAFVGPTGSGKSTLAAAFCADPAAHLVADDTVAVEIPNSPDSSGAVEVLPTQRVVWLLPDARRALGGDPNAREKVAVAVHSTALGKASLNAIVGLVFDDEVRGPQLRRLHGHEAFATLSGAVIRFVIDEPKSQLREFEQLHILAARCPIFELRRPRQLGQMRATVDLVRHLFGALPQPGAAP